MWLCHLPLELSVSPRCLWSSTNWTGIFSKNRRGGFSLRAEENNNASVLSGLKDTFHCLAHLETICKSWFIMASMSFVFVDVKPIEVSSANNREIIKDF